MAVYKAIQELEESEKKLKIRLKRKTDGEEQQSNLKRLIGDKLYYKLMWKGGIILDSDGRVVKFGIWHEDGEGDCMLYKYERKELSFMIKDLWSLPNLTYIDLSNTGIRGDIADLKLLRNLTVIDIQNTGIIGNIKTLKWLRKLTDIWLCNTGVTGNIAHLKSLPNLTYLYLEYTGVSGEAKAFKELPKFNDIWLRGVVIRSRYDDELFHKNGGHHPNPKINLKQIN